MPRYYTRACNFYYGSKSKILVKKKKSIPLNGNSEISFDQIELISRKSKKRFLIKELSKISKSKIWQIKQDLKKITSKKKNFAKFKFSNLPNVMGILNLTPDSFSDGGKFNEKNKGIKQAIKMYKSGANIIDVGGESTKPGSKGINAIVEWNRINKILKSIC